MTNGISKIIFQIFCVLLLFATESPCDNPKSKRKTASKDDNPIIVFLKENNMDLSKKVVAIQVTGFAQSDKGQIAVMKLISIKEEPNLKKMKFANKQEEEAAKKSLAFIKGVNKLNSKVIKTVVDSIITGTVIKDGDTAKVADLQVFFEDSSSFNVVVGEEFSQIVFEKIIKKPENPFTNEPVEKSVKILSFISPNLLKSVQLILEPKKD